jgi:hypothetical protein
MNRQSSFWPGWIAVAVLFAGWVPLPAQKGNGEASEVHRLFLEDQADRERLNGVLGSSAEWQKVKQRDRQRQARLRKLLTSNALKSGQDYHDAAFIFQHGDTSEDYLLAHTLAIASVAKGDQDGRWIAAATLDRYLQSVKKPQIFGTQYSKHGAKAYTQEPFNRNFLTDAVREALCVPTRDQQGKDLERLNKNLSPEALSKCM